MARAEVRVGDWNCKECGNLNYAFRPECNRCKHPKVHVPPRNDKQPKWRPRPGDWICRGCSNNNYSFRENCNKCGEPKDAFEPPAMMDEMARPVRPGVDHFWGNTVNGFVDGGPFSGGNLQPRDWLCSCGFLNYSLDTRCNQCQMPPLGSSSHGVPLPIAHEGSYPGFKTKRVTMDDFVDDWMQKRQNVRDYSPPQLMLPPGSAYEAWPPADHPSLNQRNDPLVSRGRGPTSEFEPSVFPGHSSRYWREGDWICRSCENHNYASREFCNRCKSQRNATGKLGSVY